MNSIFRQRKVFTFPSPSSLPPDGAGVLGVHLLHQERARGRLRPLRVHRGERARGVHLHRAIHQAHGPRPPAVSQGGFWGILVASRGSK